MKIYLIINRTKPEAFKLAQTAGTILAEEGAVVLLDELATRLKPAFPHTALTEQDAFAQCDIALCIGGDGTMLHAARYAMWHNKPLIGINIGRLGFLTLIESDELEKLRRLPRGEYTVEKRGVLQTGFEENGEEIGLAWNDVVLYKKPPDKMVAMDIYCDDVLVSSFRGDGVIFSTATGSTAYSMSAGGPILDAAIDGIIVTQICAHIVHMPPMVFSATRTIRVVPHIPKGGRIPVMCDGEKSGQLKTGQSLIIKKATHTVPLIQFADADQLKSIDKKLKGR